MKTDGDSMLTTFQIIGLLTVAGGLGLGVLAAPGWNDAKQPNPIELAQKSDRPETSNLTPQPTRAVAPSPSPPAIERVVTVESGDTLINLLLEVGVDEPEAFALSSALATVFDPRKLTAGQKISVVTRRENGRSGSECIRSLSFSPATDQLVTVDHDTHGSFSSKIEPLTHEARVIRRTGAIRTSFFEAAREAGIPISILLSTYRTFSHVLDFQRELNAGDRFEIAYTIYDDDAVDRRHPGEVMFARMTVNGSAFRAYRYTTSDGYTGYFDQSGRSLATGLMKTPIDSARLSSLFGKREHPVLGYTRMHRGVDFAAAQGTPILAAGDGMIEQRGRNGDFGNYIRVTHGKDYSTAYAHLSAYVKGLSVGDRVRQGDTIGYVGSTGLATGPNLHYEVLVNDRQVDPLAITSPPNRVLRGEELARFEAERMRLATLMDSLDDVADRTSDAKSVSAEVSQNL
ncbi:MAG: peptidoglycan DD-metalloendopeptidase family protein [Rhodospirillales bacterium]